MENKEIPEQVIVPFNGVNLDKAPEYLAEGEVLFLKNLTDNASDNPNITSGEGSNEVKHMPLLAPVPYQNVPLPAVGLNWPIGRHEHLNRNRTYLFYYNSANQHGIYEIDGATGTCSTICRGPFLNFKMDEQHFIGEGRVAIQTTTRLNPLTQLQEEITFIIFTDWNDEVHFLCREDSMATNSFDSNTFPYFGVPQADFRNYYNLGVIPPQDFMTITPIPRDLTLPDERSKQNKLNYRVIQLRTQYVDIWGRPSEYGPIATYINTPGNSCVAGSSSTPRKWNLRFQIGAPSVNAVNLLVRFCNGGTRGLSTTNDWFLYDTIYKYDDTIAGKRWYERNLKGTLNYTAADNTMQYEFANDKEKIPVDFSSTNRLYNPLPISSSSVWSQNLSIALARNEKDYEPISASEIKKVKYTVLPPDPATIQGNATRKITIWGVIYAYWDGGNGTPIRLDSDKKTILFGDNGNDRSNPRQHNQVLPADQQGIIAYLAGTDSYDISEQWSYDRSTGAKSYCGLKFTSDGDNTPLQKWEFNVLPGRYVFRVASHTASPTDNFQKTSTRVMGQTDLNNLGSVTNLSYEIIVDACNGDVEIFQNPIMICDFVRDSGGDKPSSAEGYLWEDDMGDKIGIELARVDISDGGIFNSSDKLTCPNNRTDHNGFYWATALYNHLQVTLYGWKNCVPDTKLAEGSQSADSGNARHRYNELYVYKGQPYPVRDRYLVKGKILLCGSTTFGVPGALVNLTRGSYGISDRDGEYTIIAHNLGDTAEVRTDNLIFSQTGVCGIGNCNGGYCVPMVPVSSPPCNGTNERSVAAPDQTVSVRGNGQSGPKMSGRYFMGISCEDWMGRQTFPQGDETAVVDIPSIQQTGAIGFSTIRFDITGIRLPLWVKKINFFVSEEVNEDDYLTWPIDRVQFIDITGNTNTAAPTAIRLYYQGLNEYNKQNNFSTNTQWEFLIQNAGNTETVLGDLIEFIANGDGTIFKDRTMLQAQYDKEGKYIQVEYDQSLKGLTDGCLVRFIRPKESSDQLFYYQVPPNIDVVNGIPQVFQGTVELKDTYLLARQVPIPVVIPKTTTDSDGNEIETSDTINELRNYGFQFMHHSPSDFWGSHCWNKGRVNIKNPEAKKHFQTTGIDLSGSISADGITNYLHYFDNDKSVIFDKQEWGGIVAGLAEIGIVLIICENNNFLLSFSDNRAYADANGNIIAASGSQLFSRPQGKIGGNYGCQMKDYFTIQRRHGLVYFVDSTEAAWLQHNYAECRDITEGKIRGWFTSKLKAITAYNAENSPHKYLHSVIDPKTGEVLLTDVILGNTDISNYVNVEVEPVPAKNETIAYQFKRKSFRFYSATPQLWGTLNGDNKDQQLLSFVGAKPWAHYNVNSPNASYNTFYGIIVAAYVDAVFNQDSEAVKSFLSTRIVCRKLFYAQRVISEQGQLSRIMPLWFRRIEQYFSADFKGDLNSDGSNFTAPWTPLLDGDKLKGRYLQVRYTTTIADRNKYFELMSLNASFLPV